MGLIPIIDNSMKHSRQIPLQHKILFGYIILMAIITSMVAVLFHERNRVEAIETEAIAIRQIRRDGNTILHQISVLAFTARQPSLGRRRTWPNTGNSACVRTPCCGRYIVRILSVRGILTRSETCWQARSFTYTRSCGCPGNRTVPIIFC